MGDVTAVDHRNGRMIVIWSLVSAVIYVGVARVLASDSPPEGTVAWVLAIGAGLVGFGAILAYRRFLRETDELMRRIQLEGVAFGFGVALLFSLVYPLFEGAGAADLDLADSAGVMSLAYVLGVVVARRRYQ